MIKQTVLPFKLEKTRDLITAHSGLALLGEFAVGLGVLKALDKDLPGPGSGAGYRAGEHVFPLMLMLNGGGRSLEDLRQIRDDAAYQAEIINYCDTNKIAYAVGGLVCHLAKTNRGFWVL